MFFATTFSIVTFNALNGTDRLPLSASQFAGMYDEQDLGETRNPAPTKMRWFYRGETYGERLAREAKEEEALRQKIEREKRVLEELRKAEQETAEAAQEREDILTAQSLFADLGLTRTNMNTKLMFDSIRKFIFNPTLTPEAIGSVANNASYYLIANLYYTAKNDAEKARIEAVFGPEPRL